MRSKSQPRYRISRQNIMKLICAHHLISACVQSRVCLQFQRPWYWFPLTLLRCYLRINKLLICESKWPLLFNERRLLLIYSGISLLSSPLQQLEHIQLPNWNGPRILGWWGQRVWSKRPFLSSITAAFSLCKCHFLGSCAPWKWNFFSAGWGVTLQILRTCLSLHLSGSAV